VEDVRGFQLHLTSSGAGIPKINTTISALRFFFNVTLDRPDLSRHLSTVHKPRKVPVILSPDEMARFLEAAPGIKYKAAFSVAYGAGLRVSEVASLKVDVTYLGGIERGRRNRSLGAVRVEASS
jgi:integrase/recombinase XerD